MNKNLATLVRRHVKIVAHPYEGLPLVLASGVGRSGTTALRHSLGVHPDLHSTGTENNIMYDVLETARHNCTYPSRRATMHVAPPAYDRQFRLLLLNLLWPKPRRGKNRPRALMASTDLLPPRAEYFQRTFPGGRIIYIVRNGIEVVSSRMTHPNFKDTPFEEHCRIWCQSRDMAAWGAGRQGFALIRHETLLTPEGAHGAMTTALAGLGLPFHQGCVDELASQQFHPTAFAHEDRAAAADLRQRHARWQHWTDAQREVFERICGDAMRGLDYPVPWLERKDEGL
ncbi:MAG: sulfotransferase [Verrucomicrobia bacterium]|nr:sulfotransferase [Verrucomicrobiota bacterium]